MMRGDYLPRRDNAAPLFRLAGLVVTGDIKPVRISAAEGQVCKIAACVYLAVIDRGHCSSRST